MKMAGGVLKVEKLISIFNGIASNENGRWYIRNGKVDFSYNGYVTQNGVRYHVVNGKVK